jgi:hypothetical protein
MAEFTSADQVQPRSFSDGVDKLVATIRPHGRPETAFPASLGADDTRRANGETLHAWFVRLVDKHCGGEPGLVGIEENIALMANFKWEKDRLIYACVPTLVTVCTLEDYYLDGSHSATYFRLDLNDKTLGEPFSHPLPHIHVGDADTPRFALDGGTSGNVVMDFLEFIYRNHVPAKWLQWARREWLPKGSDEKRVGQFNRIVQAFRDPQLTLLRDNARVIAQIKKRLRESKDSFFKAHMEGADREILEYPVAR